MNDVGAQYRSAIFFTTPAPATAEREASASAFWNKPITTGIRPSHVPAAAAHHQDYLIRTPG